VEFPLPALPLLSLRTIADRTTTPDMPRRPPAVEAMPEAERCADRTRVSRDTPAESRFRVIENARGMNCLPSQDGTKDVRWPNESGGHTSGSDDLQDRSSPCSIGKSFVLAPFLFGHCCAPLLHRATLLDGSLVNYWRAKWSTIFVTYLGEIVTNFFSRASWRRSYFRANSGRKPPKFPGHRGLARPYTALST